MMDNRAIRFRAWDATNGWMMPNFDNWLDFDGNYWQSSDKKYDTPHQEIEQRKDVILMEYLGVNDRVGVPICESDILRTPRNDWGVVDGSGLKRGKYADISRTDYIFGRTGFYKHHDSRQTEWADYMRSRANT